MHRKVHEGEGQRPRPFRRQADLIALDLVPSIKLKQAIFWVEDASMMHHRNYNVREFSPRAGRVGKSNLTRAGIASNYRNITTRQHNNKQMRTGVEIYGGRDVQFIGLKEATRS